MDADYEKQRMEARSRYSRTVDDGSRVTLRLEGEVLTIQMPVRLDYLVTEAARREAKTFVGKFRSIDIHFQQTEYLDSSGLGLLLGLRALLPDGSGKPRILGAKAPGVKLPIHHSKFNLLFDIQD